MKNIKSNIEIRSRKNNSNKFVTFRMTSEERKLLFDYVKLNGMTVSGFIRKRVFVKGMKKAVQSSSSKRLAGETKKPVVKI